MPRTRLDFPDRSTLLARQKLVLDHFHDEVVHRWDDVLATFPHPHYELIPTLAVHDGDAEVRAYYRASRVAFPDQDHEIIELRHSADAVVVEFWLTGTHEGPLYAIPPMGGRFRIRCTAFFVFDENETLVCERVYFDSLGMLKQLIGGLSFRDPRSIVKLVKALRGLAAMTRTPDVRLVQTPAPVGLEP